MSVQPQRRRWLRWVLGLSLALNLLFVGAFAGAAFRHMRQPDDLRGGPPNVLGYGGPFARSLPPEGRRALIRGLRRDIEGMPDFRERRVAYRQMLAALRSVPFEPEVIEDIFAQQGDLAQRVQSYAQGKWLALVTEMSAADRQAVADRLEQALRRPRKRKSKGSGG